MAPRGGPAVLSAVGLGEWARLEIHCFVGDTVRERRTRTKNAGVNQLALHFRLEGVWLPK